MPEHFPRQVSCAAGKAYYTCYTGSYSGCCSTDPCDIGFCGDDSSNSSTTPTTLASPSATLTSGTDATQLSPQSTSTDDTGTATTPSSFRPSTPALPLTSTSQTTSSPDTTRNGSTKAPTSMTSDSKHSSTTSAGTGIPTNSPHHISTPAIAGGILGGLALLALLAALLWFCCRKKTRFSLSINRKKQEDKVREEKLREAQKRVADNEEFLDAHKKAQTDSDPSAAPGGSPYPRNSTAMPPARWI